LFLFVSSVSFFKHIKRQHRFDCRCDLQQSRRAIRLVHSTAKITLLD
jgi:hypothetical protein